MSAKTKLAELNLESEVHNFLVCTRTHAHLVVSAEKVQFKGLALLAAWEAIATADPESSHWLDLWRQEISESPIAGIDASAPAPGSEEKKAYSRVENGLKRVLNTAIEHWAPGKRLGGLHFEAATTSTVLFRLIDRSFSSVKSVASPGGYEVFLLALIELFEQAIAALGASPKARFDWQAEISRLLPGGPADSKTLADANSSRKPMERITDDDRTARVATVNQVLMHLRRMAAKMKRYLKNRSSQTVRRV